MQNVSLICIFIETLCQHVAANSTNFRFKMFLERFFHHKLNFKFAFLETQKKKEKKRKNGQELFKIKLTAVTEARARLFYELKKNTFSENPVRFYTVLPSLVI